MQALRILMLSQFYPPVIGGEERHVRSLGSGLASRGHQVKVATQAQAGQPATETELGMDIHRLGGTLQRGTRWYSEPQRRHMPPFPDPEFLLNLRRLVREFAPHVVHAHNWVVHSYAPLKAITRAPLVLTLHDYGMRCPKKNFMHEGAPCTGPSWRKCLPCAGEHYGALKGAVTTLGSRAMTALSPVDQYLAVSGAVAEGNALAAQSRPWSVVPNFIPDLIDTAPDSQDARLAQLPDEPFLLFVGDLRRQKGLHVVLEAYERLPVSVRPALVLIGRPCPDTPEHLPEGTRVLANWPHTAVMQAWQRAMLGLAPSIWPEPCATVVLEAMYCGKPVIASDMGGNPDMVEHERTGLLVPAEDALALSAALQRLIGDPALRARLGEAARHKVRDFQAGSVIPRIEAIYQRMVRLHPAVETPRDSASAAATPAHGDH